MLQIHRQLVPDFDDAEVFVQCPRFGGFAVRFAAVVFMIRSAANFL
jgi:hypothetical protein